MASFGWLPFLERVEDVLPGAEAKLWRKWGVEPAEDGRRCPAVMDDRQCGKFGGASLSYEKSICDNVSERVDGGEATETYSSDQPSRKAQSICISTYSTSLC